MIFILPLPAFGSELGGGEAIGIVLLSYHGDNLGMLGG